MGRFPDWKSPGKQPIKKRGIKRFLRKQTFWRDIPGFCRHVRELSEKFEKKVWFSFFWPLNLIKGLEAFEAPHFRILVFGMSPSWEWRQWKAILSVNFFSTSPNGNNYNSNRHLMRLRFPLLHRKLRISTTEACVKRVSRDYSSNIFEGLMLRHACSPQTIGVISLALHVRYPLFVTAACCWKARTLQSYALELFWSSSEDRVADISVQLPMNQQLSGDPNPQYFLGALLRGRTATQRSKKGSEKVLGRVLGKGFSEGFCEGGLLWALQ